MELHMPMPDLSDIAGLTNISDDGSFDTTAEAELVDSTNTLLKNIGTFPKLIASYDELKNVASSMFVAVFESIFHLRLEGVVRLPQTRAHFVNNVQRVIDELAQSARLDLSHISGESIADGDVKAISNLVRVFWRIFLTIKNTQSRQGDITSRKELKIQKQDEKIAVARDRRTISMSMAAQKRAINALRHDRVVRTVKDRRLKDSIISEMQSYDAISSTQDEVILRKAYAAILHRMHQQLREEKAAEQREMEALRQDAQQRQNTVDALFRERVQMLEECRKRTKGENELAMKSLKALLNTVADSTRQSQEKEAEISASKLRQSREAAIRNRTEAHKALIELLAVEDWSDYYQDRFLSDKYAHTHARRPLSAPAASARRDSTGRRPGFRVQVGIRKRSSSNNERAGSRMSTRRRI